MTIGFELGGSVDCNVIVVGCNAIIIVDGGVDDGGLWEGAS